MSDAHGDTRVLEARLVDGRPQLGVDLDALRDRVLAGVARRAPRRIGRYVLGNAIGSGAFGTVYEAEDPELRRKVAIKLFVAGTAAQDDRVLREARSLATLSSPNVVHVFEVGVVDDGTAAPYLVMELVDGPTWRAHLAAAQRPWRETVEVGIAAARGLAAAHRAGVVHRDVKPDNVILASDGRPRVVDFGLARAVAEVTEDGHASLSDDDVPTLTPVGHVLGTPAYMAPEAFMGPCTPLSDQYSLCVSLFEALFGVRPFQVRSTDELVRRVGSEDAIVPRDRRGVPPAVIAAVMRGLRRDPQRRHRDLEALEVALDRARRSRRAFPLVVVGLVATSVAAIAATTTARQSCVTSDSVWTRMRSIDDELAAQRDAYAQRWRATEQSLCATSGDAIPESARRCLDRRLDEVVAVGELVHTLDDDARARLRDPFAELPAPEECERSRGDEVRTHVVVDPSAVARIEDALTQVRAHTILAQYGDALASTTGLLAEARAIGYAPIEVEVAHAHARLLLIVSQYREAAAAFERTFHAAQAAGLDREAAGAASELLRTYAGYLGDPRAARTWAEHAQTSFARLDTDPHTHGVYAEGIAALLMQEGDVAGGVEALRDAIAAATDRGDANAGMTGGLHNRLGVALLQLEQPAEAAVALARAAEIFAATNGLDSPPRASALSNEGLALDRLGRHEEALARHREALAIREPALGPDHLDLGASLGNMAETLGQLGRHEEALGYIDRALALFERRLGPEHPNIAIGLDIRGRIREHGDAAARAAAHDDFTRAARIYEAAGQTDAAAGQRRRAEAITQERTR